PGRPPPAVFGPPRWTCVAARQSKAYAGSRSGILDPWRRPAVAPCRQYDGDRHRFDAAGPPAGFRLVSRAPPMSVRFCAQCGTKALAGAKFCTECGAALAGDGSASAARRWQVTTAGAAVLTVFLAAGLAIWTQILSPASPRPGPGAGAARPAAARAGAPSSGGEAKARTPLPAEVVSFIADLAAKAKAKPDDVDMWLKL